MIIVNLTGGLGNQLFQYAAGRNLANRWHTELKVNLDFYRNYKYVDYLLPMFNVKASIASPEEISQIKNLVPNNQFGKEKNSQFFMTDFFNYPDNIYLDGCWESERYFANIADIVRREFVLTQPLGEVAQSWKQKINDTECSVSLHFRHGDFISDPQFTPNRVLFAILPLDYYYECVNRLKQQYPNLKLFIFSNNLQWCKENLRAEVPMEFVEGDGLRDFEELHLMSLCKHNIIANSTFSWWGAWLNQNPDKKVFVPIPSIFFGTNNHYRFFLPERNENSPFESDRWMRIPFDINAQPSVTMRPYFSILLVVNNDVQTLGESLNSMLGQDYKFFELIIIDNASTDGSGKICQQVAKNFDNVTLIKLYSKVQNGAAYNIALKAAQGYNVLFLKGNDRLLVNALSSLYLANGRFQSDLLNSIAHLREDERGDIDLSGKKFILERESMFKGELRGIFREKLNKMLLLKILSSNEVVTPLGTRLFKRKFLVENKIRFNEKIGEDSELLFVAEAMFQTEEIIFVPNIFYIAPRR